MKYAVDIPNFGVFADAHVVAETAREAEDAGWDAIWIWDHVLRDRGVPYGDPWVLLTAVALATTRIRFGPMVTPLPRTRPWLVARAAATLDRLSGGRFTLGVGMGNPPREFSATGEDPDLRVRAAKLDEGLEILTRCWTGTPFTFRGRHYSLDDVEFLPVPVQRPRIPIWLAATLPHQAPFRRAARWDGVWAIRRNPDGNSPMTTVEDIRAVRELIDTFRTSAEPFDIVAQGMTTGGLPHEAAGAAHLLEDAGATWWVERINPQRGSVLDMRERVRRGPPR